MEHCVSASHNQKCNYYCIKRMLGSVPYTLTLLKIQLLATVVCSAENTVEVDNEEGGTWRIVQKWFIRKKNTLHKGTGIKHLYNAELWTLVCHTLQSLARSTFIMLNFLIILFRNSSKDNHYALHLPHYAQFNPIMLVKKLSWNTETVANIIIIHVILRVTI